MQCPRCGLVNTLEITACARCGLPVTQSAPPPRGYYSGQPHAGQPSPRYPQAGPPPGYSAQAGYGPYGQPPLRHPGAFPHPSAPQADPATSGAASPAKPAPSKAAVVAAAVSGALLSLGYAAWAFSARRGIFQDFADGTVVTADDATVSDTLDTAFLLVAGVVAVMALLLLAKELLSRALGKWGLKLTGLLIGVLGSVAVVMGLSLASNVPDPGSQAEQGDRGVTATMVVGGGFVLVAVGLLVGSLGIRSSDTRPHSV